MSDKSKPKIIFSVEPRKDALTVIRQHDRAHDVKGKVLVGKFRVKVDRDEFLGGRNSRAYVGRILVDPTWRQIMAEARRAMLSTKDFHHVFLEGVRVSRGSDGNGVRDIELLMGS